MKFVDEVKIRVKAGDGGDGAVAFRREKYIERGGPSGGDGGDGGSVLFRVDARMSTLLDYRFLSQHQAQNGQPGMGSDCYGRKGETLVLRLPQGTLVKDADSGALLGDLSTADAELLVARGGRGGRGNMHFATSTRQAPRFAEEGTLGEVRHLKLELKLLADVGIVGFPNVGKSLFISKISRSRPKVADYPFTTLVPNLGVVAYKNHLSFVVADIPGLVEGASEGVGLGLRFLKHVERCKVLLHLVDASGHLEGRSMEEDLRVLCAELHKFSPALAQKPQLVVANKMDMPGAQEAYAAFAQRMKRQQKPTWAMSALTGEGLSAVLDAAAERLYAPETTPQSAAPKSVGGTRVVAKGAASKGAASKTAASKTAAAKGAASKTTPSKRAAAKPAASKRTASKSTPAKRTAPKTTVSKRTVAKGAAAKGAASKTAAAKTAAAKRATPKRTASKPTAAKGAAAKSAASKTTAAKRTASKRAAAKRTAAKGTASTTTASKTTAPKTAAAKRATPKRAAPKRATPKRAAPKPAASKPAASKRAASKPAAAKRAASKSAAKSTRAGKGASARRKRR